MKLQTRFWNLLVIFALAASALALPAQSATATTPAQVAAVPAVDAPFATGNIVVYRVGDGAGSLVNTGNPVFLDEYTPAGTLVQSIAMPVTQSGENRAFFASGTSTAEGLITRSTDEHYLLLTGYASTYTSSLSGTASTVVNRVVGRVDAAGTIDTTTALTDFASAGSPRSATSDSGTDLWIAGGTGGVRYTTLSATTSTQISTAVTNMRQVTIFDGQLYASDASGSAYRLSTVGVGLPTTAGQAFTNLPGFPTSTGSPYGFFFADLDGTVAGVDTLYVADDAVGIQKYSQVSGSWALNGTITGSGYRGLTGLVSGTTVTLFSISNTSVATVQDTGGYNALPSSTTLTSLATAAANTAFRGVALAPVSAVDNPPSVLTTTPADTATNVSLSTEITVNFSEAVTTSSAAFALECGSVAQPFAFSGSGASYTLNPDNNLPLASLCTLTVSASGVTDQDGTADPMAADYTMSFTTTADVPPTVSTTVPANGAINVTVGNDLSVIFSENVTTTAAAFALECGSVPQNFAFSGSGSSYTLNPDANLPYSQTCSVTITASGVTDLDGTVDAMAANYSWTFTTTHNPDAVTPIAVARAAGAGWTGTLQGNVTLLPGLLGTKSIAIQDATGGMYVYPASTFTLPPLALGDVVQVKGTIKNYNGLLEIDPVTSVNWISTGTVPAPLVVATGSVAPTQGLLIQVQGTLHLPTTPPAPGTNYTFSVNDGSGVLTGYAYKLTNIDMRGFEEGQQIRIIGLSQAYNAPQIQPRTQADLVDLRAPVVLSTVPADAATGASPYMPVTAAFNKPINPATLTEASFTLSGPSGAVSGAVSYLAGTQTAVFTPAAALAPLSLYTATLTTAVTDSNGVPLATAHSWSFTTGAADSVPPAILTRLPAPAAVDVPVSSQVAVAFSEALGTGSLNLAHFVLSGPYGTVPATFGYDPVTFTVTLTPQASLLYSTQYTMTVTASTADFAGNPLGADDVWTFTTMAEPGMQVYFGDLHNHTSYSDGSGTPAEALAAGKAAGFDFMAISDHSYAISDSEWADTLSAVNAATGSDFVGLRGFEYTQGAEGHINVWNSERHATRTNVPGCTYCDYTPNLEAGTTVTGFYPWLVSPVNTPLDSAGEVMQFNHPGWINFNDWFYHPEVSGIAKLEEVGNGSGTSYVFSEAEFIRSLDYGWKLGATNNADTHSTYWGVNTDHRTGVLMPELTKMALLEALRQRRTFASEDKNFTLTMKANGAWMGSEIANTGSIAFDISGMDPDGELASLVELITDQGKTIASTVPSTASFTWEPDINITTGVHYFYIKATQADGDKIVTSPVWTLGSEDISITDLTIQPTIPTTNNPSLFSVRVTNRVAESRTVTVGIEVNGVPLGAGVAVTVPANGDGYALFNWQPILTGAVTITAQFTDAPAGDNPDDNSLALNLTVTDELLPLILIDGGHGNLNTAANEMKAFIDDLSAHHYNVLKNLDALTAADLNPAVVKLLIITAPETAYTAAEQTAIANYVAAGGSLWMGGLADYTGKVAWASTVADRENAILDTIASVTGQTVNMRMNDDEVTDANSNNGYVFGVIWGDFPSAGTTGIGVNVEQVSTWSLNSIVDGNKQALTAADAGVQIIMQGDLDAGYGAAPWYDPNHTSNEDADGQNDAFIYNPTWVYPADQPADAVPVPAAAAVELANGAGRIMLYGDSNDPFTIFAYTAGDGKQNELFNLQSVMWLLGDQLQKSTVAEARAQAADDVPDNLNKLVWVEGEITAAYGEFFNVLYVQDETGGITVHAPAGDIDPAAFTRGTHVRVVGTVDIYNGDTEIQFFEAEMVQVIAPSTGEPVPTVFTTLQASLEANEGWLVRVTGRVTSKVGLDTFFVDDGSGPVRVFLDGYNGSFADIRVNDIVQVTGLASEDGDGQRIRVRNHDFHIGIPDDVIVTGHTPLIYLPIIGRGN